MSYTIFYRAMYLRLSDGTLVPIIESGDNNVWEDGHRGRMRRAREWTACRWLFETAEQKDRISLTEKEILDLAKYEVDRVVNENDGKTEPFRNGTYTKDRILSDLSFFNCIHVTGGSRSNTATQFVNFMRSGIRHSVTFDDLTKDHCAVVLSWYEDSNYVKDYARSEEELRSKWNELLTRGIHPWVGYDYPIEHVWSAMKRRTQKPKTERLQPENYHVISFKHYDSLCYVVKLMPRHLHHSPWRDSAYKYRTQKAAENAVKRIGKRFDGCTDFRVETVAAN